MFQSARKRFERVVREVEVHQARELREIRNASESILAKHKHSESWQACDRLRKRVQQVPAEDELLKMFELTDRIRESAQATSSYEEGPELPETSNGCWQLVESDGLEHESTHLIG